MKKWLYDLIYRFIPADWIFGSSSKIEGFVDLAVNGRIESGHVITLGCGVGRETIYLAKKGFQVTGLDFSSTAIQKARRNAKAEGIEARFLVDDLTNLRHIRGTFDLVTDFGAFNDLSQKARDLYMKNVLPLTYPSSKYVMFCFDKMLSDDEVRQRFENAFSIDIVHNTPGNRYPGGLNLYFMTRNTQ